MSKVRKQTERGLEKVKFGINAQWVNKVYFRYDLKIHVISSKNIFHNKRKQKKLYICTLKNTVDVAQLVRALDCGSRSRRFESGLPPEKLVKTTVPDRYRTVVFKKVKKRVKNALFIVDFRKKIKLDDE